VQVSLTDQGQMDTFRRVTDQSVRSGFARLIGRRDEQGMEEWERVVSLTARAVSFITRMKPPLNEET
jgi:hypothetical protein